MLDKATGTWNTQEEVRERKVIRGTIGGKEGGLRLRVRGREPKRGRRGKEGKEEEGTRQKTTDKGGIGEGELGKGR